MTPMLAQLAGLFTVPGLAAAGAVAVSIPIAIHLLTRLRRKPQPWAAMRFLMEAYRKHRSRLQLEQLLLLLVRCLAVLALGLALAGPMLGGLAAALGPDAQQRLVVFVLDDSLSSQATGGGTSRFAALRQQALAMLDELGPADQVAIYRAARPLEAVIAPPTLDHGAVRQALAAMQPRHARSALADTLGEVAGLLKTQDVSADRCLVVVLSDFANTSVALDRPGPTALGQHAQVLVSRPSPETANVQIAALQPRRQMILVERRMPPTVPVELRLRRFGSDSGDALASVSVQVIGVSGQVVASAQREHRWSPGQTEALLNLELPAAEAMASGNDTSGGAMITLRATLQGAAGDSLEADNTAQAVVELRQRLLVAVVGDRGAAVGDAAGGFDPERWLTAALTPWSVAGDAATTGPVEVLRLPASTLDAAALAPVDAAIVVRPDLLADAAWLALRELLMRGGLVWIMPPAEPAPAVWSAALRERFGSDWQIEIEPQTSPPDQPWSLASDSAAPEPLRLLSADWQALLRPVRVSQRLAVRTMAGADTVWLRTDDQQPLLLVHAAGDGQLILLATAVSPQWSNLPTKPLFVPLLHETLRGVLGTRGGLAAVAGDQPSLGWRWDLSEALVLADDASAAPVLLRRSDEGLAPVSALQKPGVWVGRPAARGLRLAVNVDADAGDTRPLDERLLGEWFSRLGTWQWLEPGQSAAAMSTQAVRSNLGWPLLWATLGLLLLETALARWFSHARTGGDGLFQRALRAMWGAR